MCVCVLRYDMYVIVHITYVYTCVCICTNMYVYIYMCVHTCIYVYNMCIDIVVAQGGGGSFKIGNLQERLVVVNHGWESDPPDGLKGGWTVGQSICLSVYPPVFLSIYLSVCLSIYLSTYLCATQNNI